MCYTFFKHKLNVISLESLPGTFYFKQSISLQLSVPKAPLDCLGIQWVYYGAQEFKHRKQLALGLTHDSSIYSSLTVS